MTQPTHPLADCYSVHQSLVERAMSLSLRLARERADEADLLRLGATCVRIGAQQALEAREPRQAIKGWSECELGERQIRSATCHALRHQHIDNRIYDALFRVAGQALRKRRDEIDRMRVQLKLLAVI
jgi:hypothetical protein